eukprot:m.192664 g.192664  ORF g.192664 m.192664 type:complete len:889 (-) comp18271_c0_seq9:157-2823(-)
MAGATAALALLLLLACSLAPASTDTPVYLGVPNVLDNDDTVILQADLVEGWYEPDAQLPSQGGHAVLRKPDPTDACSPLNNAHLLRDAIVFVESGPTAACPYLQQVLAVQEAGAVGVLLWDKDDAGLELVPITPARPSAYSIPPMAVRHHNGESLHDALITGPRVIQFPIDEPDDCFEQHNAVIRQVQQTATEVTLNGTFPGDFSACWFFRDDSSPTVTSERPCYEESSTSRACAVTPIIASTHSNGMVTCRVPNNLANVQQLRVVVESVFESRSSRGNFKVTHCFSHRHQPLRLWRTGEYGVVLGGLKLECSTNCSGNGKCVGVELCDCFEPFFGAVCSDLSSSNNSTEVIAVAVAVILAFLLLCLLIWFVCYKKERHTLFVLHHPPESGEPPAVSRIVTTKRSFSLCSREARDDDDYDSLQMLRQHTQGGQAPPSYQQSLGGFRSNPLTSGARVADEDAISYLSEPPAYDEAVVDGRPGSRLGNQRDVVDMAATGAGVAGAARAIAAAAATAGTDNALETPANDPFQRPTTRGRAFLVTRASNQPITPRVPRQHRQEGTTTPSNSSGGGGGGLRRLPPPPTQMPRLQQEQDGRRTMSRSRSMSSASSPPPSPPPTSSSRARTLSRFLSSPRARVAPLPQVSARQPGAHEHRHSTRRRSLSENFATLFDPPVQPPVPSSRGDGAASVLGPTRPLSATTVLALSRPRPTSASAQLPHRTMRRPMSASVLPARRDGSADGSNRGAQISQAWGTGSTRGLGGNARPPLKRSVSDSGSELPQLLPGVGLRRPASSDGNGPPSAGDAMRHQQRLRSCSATQPRLSAPCLLSSSSSSSDDEDGATSPLPHLVPRPAPFEAPSSAPLHRQPDQLFDVAPHPGAAHSKPSATSRR